MPGVVTGLQYEMNPHDMTNPLVAFLLWKKSREWGLNINFSLYQPLTGRKLNGVEELTIEGEFNDASSGRSISGASNETRMQD